MCIMEVMMECSSIIIPLQAGSQDLEKRHYTVIPVKGKAEIQLCRTDSA